MSVFGSFQSDLAKLFRSVEVPSACHDSTSRINVKQEHEAFSDYGTRGIEPAARGQMRASEESIQASVGHCIIMPCTLQLGLWHLVADALFSQIDRLNGVAQPALSEYCRNETS